MNGWGPVLILVLAFGFLMGGMLNSQVVYYNESSVCIRYEPYIKQFNESETNIVFLYVPAVDSNGNGVSTELSVQLVPGTGKSLVNIDKILFWADTQSSIRTAVSVAENVMGINISSVDLIYSIKANASVIEGPSAGAALAVATAAVLTGREVNTSVMITGEIGADGSIRPIGEVVAKAKAAKSIGAQLFLVPLGQSKEITYQRKETCKKVGLTDICQIEDIPHTVMVEDEAGIKVVEVGNINDALEYFLF